MIETHPESGPGTLDAYNERVRAIQDYDDSQQSLRMEIMDELMIKEE